jgi:hypothetical protein
MPRISIFGLGKAAKSPFVTAKELINIYCEQRPQGEGSMLVGYGTPGLDPFCNIESLFPSRGGIEFAKDAVGYVVNGSTLYQVSFAQKTVIGTLSTSSGRVSMAHNGVQVMIVDGRFGYIYNTSTLTFAQISDADFPSNPATCCFAGRRFVVGFVNSSRFYWSDIDDGLTWDALNFANAESNPDSIVSVYASNGQVILFGSDTTEFWGNSGIADPAFIALQGNASEWGLAARWSLAKYDNSLMCLMKNRMGQVMVAQLNGYLPKKVSTIDMDAIINAYSVVSDASGYSYMLGGHPMYVINFPTASYSWLFDGSTGIWTRLKSFGSTRHRAEFSFNVAGKIIVSNHENGELYELTDTTFTDNKAVIEREIVGETLIRQDGEFLTVDKLRIDMETGVGLTAGQGVNPQISLSVSRDNGKTYGPEMWKTMGAIGEYSTRVEWRRLGASRSFTPRIRMTDPVKAVFVGASINPVD